MLFDEELRAEVAAVLLVAQHHEDDVTARFELPAGGPQERRHVHCDCALHVDRPPAPDLAVHELAAEGRMRPLLSRCRDHVDVALQQERLGASLAPQPGDEVRPGRVFRIELGRDAGVLEEPTDELDARRLVAGRIRCVEPDEVLEKLD